MNLTEIIILAIALGIDCLVASFAQGLILKQNKFKNSILLALSMGFFQGFMPVLGYFGISYADDFIIPYSKFIVCAIFSILGIKFIFEAFNQKTEVCCLNWKCIIILSIATSIDALFSGITLNLTGTSLLLPVIIIGFASFLMSLKGFYAAIFFKKIPSKFLEITGGAILLLLAVKAVL